MEHWVNDINYFSIMYSNKKLIEASIPNCQKDSIKLVALKCHERSHKIQVRKLFRKLLIKDYELQIVTSVENTT